MIIEIAVSDLKKQVIVLIEHMLYFWDGLNLSLGMKY